ncbi:type III secretion system chaperone [Parachlamydia acanthamoebae]|uniref:Type III secretion specific chlamydia chaperone 1 n=1 Tax=Parachlamydia acanthamoebae TaxID=83552 RepID=A0A0C1EK00_9BACT|nr:type III secretion system chaperone [Parachlamydia acanthamoebae]KIA76859.1 hypothetical protein DB43_HG00050 [Parachlamydia acanthamoebae]
MQLEEILREYGRRKGIGKLELDDEGICRLMINKTSTISFEKSLFDNGFFIYTSVGILPVDKEKELSLSALIGNLFGKETGQAHLGYEPNSRSLVLFTFISYEGLTYSKFNSDFEEFIYYMLYWISKFEELKSESGESTKKGLYHPIDEKNKNIFYA